MLNLIFKIEIIYMFVKKTILSKTNIKSNIIKKYLCDFYL